MTDGSENIFYLLKVIFWGIIPAMCIFFRLKKKIRTGFTAGLILLSVMFSFIVMATVQRERAGDPVKNFVQEVNAGNYEGAVYAYRLLIQAGPSAVEKLDEKDLLDPEMYRKIRTETGAMYRSIAEKYIKAAEETESSEEKTARLKHAETMLLMAGYTGAADDSLLKKTEALLAAEKEKN